MPDEDQPPRKRYQFKPKEFERVNAVPVAPSIVEQPRAPSPPPEISNPGRIDVLDLAKIASSDLKPVGPARSIQENDVHGMLKELHAREVDAGLHRVQPPPRRPNRKLREYLLLIALTNGFLLALPLGPMATLGMGFSTIAITWLMWVVMGRY